MNTKAKRRLLIAVPAVFVIPTLIGCGVIPVLIPALLGVVLNLFVGLALGWWVANGLYDSDTAP